jgi:hypothetical protein
LTHPNGLGGANPSPTYLHIEAIKAVFFTHSQPRGLEAVELQVWQRSNQPRNQKVATQMHASISYGKRNESDKNGALAGSLGYVVIFL